MRTSYSALETFQNCPAKYKFQEIDRIKTPKSKEAVFGTLIHNALKMLHEPSRLVPVTEEELLQYFNQHWNSSIYENATEEAIAFHEGVKILKDYYQKNHPSKFNIIDLETFCEIPVLDGSEMHLITGKIDRIDKLEDGTFEIIDYKTTKKMPSQKLVDENFQLSLYYLAIINRWPSLQKQNKRVKLSLYYLKHGEKLSTFRTPEHINQIKEKILDIINQIKKCLDENKFEPKPNSLCDWCAYQEHCPLFKHKYIKRQEISVPEQNIEELIDEFLELKIKNEKDLKRMAEIKEIINKYCDQNNLERLFGQKGYITRLPQKKFSYDIELVRQILMPIGKWEEILSIDSNKLKKVVKELPWQIREKIEKAKRLEKEFKVFNVKYIKQQETNDKRQTIYE